MGFRTRFTERTAQGFLLAILVSGLSAQISETRPQIGVPEDWTHHRIRFSNAKLREHPELAAAEPRAAMQLYRQAFMQARAAMGLVPATETETATTSSPHRDWSVTLGSGRLQPGAYPAKWQADPTAAPSCTTDFVIYGLNVAGVTGGQPSIVGLNRLYSDAVVGTPLCSGLQPNFLFSYNTTTFANGRILTSPVLSLDGKNVAFIETSTVAGARTSSVHVLKIPTSGSQVTATPAADPPAGALASLSIAAATNSRSSPWVDYKSDTLYVGLDNGRLYKVTGIFKGTPTLAGAPWPILIANNQILSSPVLDSNTGNLFIGSANGRVVALNVNSPTPTTIQVGKVGGTNPAIFDSPMFDATGGTIFAITSNDNAIPGASVTQIDATTFGIVTRVAIGLGSSGGTSVNLFDGDFDDAYFTNPSTGHLFVCGTGAADTTPHRYLLNFNGSGVLQPGSSIQLSTDAASRCGPVTEFRNSNIAGGTDFFFWGVSRSCPGFGVTGCVMALANETTLSSTKINGGTSGIIIDNNYVTQPGGSSIYFSSQANPNTAFKVTQQGLQ
jgi:hypothetical protein